MTTSRNELNGKLVVLVGGSGFFGAHVAQDLLSRGARLRVVCRTPKKAYRLKALANLGQIQFVRADLADRSVLPAIVAGADGVVNLVGAFKGDLDTLHVRAPAALARAAREAGVGAFVQISALGCDAESDVDYARTKAEGEAAVRAEFPAATILRPSILFGQDDNFVNMFAGLISRLPVLPVFGPEAKLQPVFVDDAAEAVGNALANPVAFGGKTFDLAGPDVITMGELNQRIAAAQHRKPLFAELPDAVSGLIAAATGWMPGAPLSTDQWKLLKAGNIASSGLGIKALGVEPRPLSLFLDRWMVSYRKHGRFGSKASV
ncbi:complex I NDUFA9 subunit family protein [Novosphingobium sp.]|uniref:complex I NDUFA9 subunit family protein n=1 Tax=Novosphingobium sp. TaxID=1874826 RepID=UPI00286E1669|nr:complex I NDUFA9 subunit family protein [Novosphingobium sp.]